MTAPQPVARRISQPLRMLKSIDHPKKKPPEGGLLIYLQFCRLDKVKILPAGNLGLCRSNGRAKYFQLMEKS
jgi:hypothetical protein